MKKPKTDRARQTKEPAPVRQLDHSELKSIAGGPGKGDIVDAY
jgi:hypothetical protein